MQSQNVSHKQHQDDQHPDTHNAAFGPRFDVSHYACQSFSI